MTRCIMRKQKLDGQQDYMNPNLLQEALQQLLEQISKRDQKISWIVAENRAERAEKDALLLSTQTKLMEKELQLHEIVTSRTWKLALFIQRIRVFLVPPKSRREAILQRVVRIISFPLKRIKKS